MQTQTTTAQPLSAQTVPGVIPTLALVARKWSAEIVQPIAGRLAASTAPTVPAEPTDSEYAQARRIAERAAFLLVLDNRNAAAMEITRSTGIARGAARKMIAKIADAMSADAEGLEITQHLRGDQQWPATARTIYDTCADWRAADRDGELWNQIHNQRRRQQMIGVSAYEIGSREDAIARAVEENGTTRAAQEEMAQVVAYYERRYSDREAFATATIAAAARRRYATLLAAFTPEPTRYTREGKPYPLTSDEREAQLSAWIDAISPQAIAFGDSLRTLLDWPTLYGPKTEIEIHRERRAARIARRAQQTPAAPIKVNTADDTRTDDHEDRIAESRRILAASARHATTD